MCRSSGRLLNTEPVVVPAECLCLRRLTVQLCGCSAGAIKVTSACLACLIGYRVLYEGFVMESICTAHGDEQTAVLEQRAPQDTVAPSSRATFTTRLHTPQKKNKQHNIQQLQHNLHTRHQANQPQQQRRSCAFTCPRHLPCPPSLHRPSASFAFSCPVVPHRTGWSVRTRSPSHSPHAP